MSALFAMGKKSKKALPPALPKDCPPDVAQLGRSSWTLLHSITATYPTTPPPQLQSETTTFLRTFGKLYPCWVCAEDFQAWMKSADFTAGHSQHRDRGPVGTGSELWSFDVLETETPAV